MRKTLGLSVLVLGLMLGACGSNKKSTGGGGSDAGGGNGSKDGSTAKMDGSTSTGTGDAAAKDASMALVCDNTMMGVTSCGGTACTAVDSAGAMMCQVTCCTSDMKCGQKNTSAQAAMYGLSTCQLPATLDPSCPSTMFMGTSAAGCCTPGGMCGFSAAGSQCIAFGATSKCGSTSHNDAGTSVDGG